MTDNERKVFDKAIGKWGYKAQLLMVLEEMSELQKEVCKDFRGKPNLDAIADECADVEIMLDQLKMIYGIEKHVKTHREYKIDRLAKRLEISS